MAAITTPTLIQPSEVVNGGLLKATPLNARFDVTLLSAHIADAERLHIAPAIGQVFYDALITKKNGAISNYNTAIGPLTKAFPEVADANYELLWTRHLMSLCAWAVYYEALPFIVVQTGSNGVHVPQAEYAQSVGVSGAKYLQDTALRRLRSATDLTVEYLCANAADLPLFDKTDICTGCNDTAPDNDVLARHGLFYSVD